MMINENAPVVATSEIEVAADPEIVWELIVRIFRGPMQKMLENAINAGLRHLKAEAERRSTR